MTELISKVPEGPLELKWSKHKADIKVVSPANKRKMEIIVIGTGLGGASAAASLGELGYNVKVFCISEQWILELSFNYFPLVAAARLSPRPALPDRRILFHAHAEGGGA